ncbi:DUF1453 domain-containing protein [Kitasatospora sp. NPDC052896]|uniref:DUF1453 domain-containing protein n=1 Tax=Kitasatospora sp. NPDC052896 TaxID=3364061 RepID=UPI0037C7878B
MAGLSNIVIIVAAVVFVLARQMRARRIDTERRFWLLPLILAVVALRDPSLIDPHHKAAAVGLLVVGILIEIAMGSVWGWTVRIWRDADGTVWAKGSKAALAAWVGMIALRVGLFAVAAALGVHQGTNDLLLALAALLLVRGAVVNWRAQNLEGGPRRATVLG